MTRIPHLIRADVRRSWPLLCAWVMLAIASAAAPTLMPYLANGSQRVLLALELPMALLAFAYPLLLLLLVAQIVHTHPLVGTTAFWMTRPIASRDLLLSKVILLGVAAVIVPGLIEVVRMAIYGVPWPDQLGIAVEKILTQGMWLALVMLAAAVTASLMRFVLLIGVGLVSVAAILAIVAIVFLRYDGPQTSPGWSEPYNPTSGLFELCFQTVVLAAAVVTQYLTRSRMRTAIVLALGTALTLVTPNLWPSSWWRPIDEAPAWARDNSALQLNLVEPAGMMTFGSQGISGKEWVGVRAPMEVTNIQPGYTAQVGIDDASVQIGSRKLASYRELAPARVPLAGQPMDPMFVAQRTALEVDRIPGAASFQAAMPILFFVDEAEFQQYAPATGHYHARLRVALERQEIEAVLPLTVGASHHNGGYRLTLHAIEARWDSASLQLHESYAVSAFDRAPDVSYTYYLRNRMRREAVSGTWRAIGEPTGVFFGVGVQATRGAASGFDVRELIVRFSPQDLMREKSEAVAIDADWLSGAELAIVRTTSAGSVERDLDIPDFRLARSLTASSSPR